MNSSAYSCQNSNSENRTWLTKLVPLNSSTWNEENRTTFRASKGILLTSTVFFLSYGINPAFFRFETQKKSGFAEPEIFLGFKTDPDFRMQIKRPNVIEQNSIINSSIF